MSHLNTTFDPDSFLNLDQTEFTPATTSPNIAPRALAHQSSSASTHFASSSNTQTFAGPSFQYDAYRQQTGLPVGGLANTFAVNQNSGLQHYDGQGGFVMPNETINLPLSKIEDFDFNRPFDFNEMDFEDESPSDLPTMFYPNSSSQSQFVSPTTLVSANLSPSTSTPIQRIYPGMHSQVAQAKAQQAQQKQQEIIGKQQQARQIAGQKPLPKTQPAKDPEVEESISRILSQMRQKSISSAEDDSTAAVPTISHMSRSKKDEDDMDEDELLLASEEGKKLSSKERRQLRNKVSARAFRSRRKEYIGQLEGEVNAKTEEANALRSENSQLREENTRLTDLTRMLLSSKAFAGFLQELNQTGQPESSRQQSRQERSQPQPQPTRKDVNPHEAARQLSTQRPQVGMALIPEPSVDLSLFDTPSWNSGLPSTDYHVFAVTEVPRGPTLNLSKCSEKTEKPAVLSSETMKMAPALPELPKMAEKVAVEDTVELTAHKASAMAASASLKPANTVYYPDSSRTVILDLKKTFELRLERSIIAESETGSWGSLRAMCKELDRTVKQIALWVPGMD